MISLKKKNWGGDGKKDKDEKGTSLHRREKRGEEKGK